MIKITQIATYIPAGRESNLNLCDKFNVMPDFIVNKIGVQARAVKEETDTSSSLCAKAFENLNFDESTLQEIDCCIVVTQNPDRKIPHVSALVHDKLGLSESCACFDISLGCSGYVYGINIAASFMQANSFKKGLLFTSDQYSSILDKNDKNTFLIFGDAATVTVLEPSKHGLELISSDLGSRGKDWKALYYEDVLKMKGREVFNFTASTIPKSIARVLGKASLSIEDIRGWYLHQGSKYIVDTIAQRTNIDPSKVVFRMNEYGNTVSSSIPILLAEDLNDIKKNEYICMSGFGVGLSWGTSIYQMK